MSVSSWPVSVILLQPFWDDPMTGNTLEAGCNEAPEDGLGGRVLVGKDLVWVVSPIPPTSTLSIQDIRWHDCINLGCADSAAEQQLHSMEGSRAKCCCSFPFSSFVVRSTSRGYCEISMCHAVAKGTGETSVEKGRLWGGCLECHDLLPSFHARIPHANGFWVG